MLNLKFYIIPSITPRPMSCFTSFGNFASALSIKHEFHKKIQYNSTYYFQKLDLLKLGKLLVFSLQTSKFGTNRNYYAHCS